MRSIDRGIAASAVMGLLTAGPALAGEHTWDVWEVFSNADGTVQFIELHESQNSGGEVGLSGNTVTVHPSGASFPLTSDVASPTNLKYYLLATQAFANLPGAPAPDKIIPPNFIAIATDNQARFNPWDTASWTAGTLPTNGILSLQRPGLNQALVSGTNSPTNYAGATGSIDASGGGGPALPGVPDVLLAKGAADGSNIAVSWDTAECDGEVDHQIIYGQRSGFPAIAGGAYTLLGGQCDIGTASPYAWTATPSAVDGSGLLWFLVVAEDNAGTEGSWGKFNATTERTGTGTNGSSSVCAITDRDTSDVCGH